MGTLLINKSKFTEKARFYDPNLNFDNRIAPIIREVQQVDIKPQLGEHFYNRLIAYVASHTEANEYLDKLLAGGTYTCGGDTYSFAGLESAVAYYTHANLIDANAGFLTSTGLRSGSDNYSSMADYKDKRNAFDSERKVAESYMADCIAYLNRNAKEAGWELCKTKIRKQRFYVIGQ